MSYYKRFVDETFDENGNLESYKIKDGIEFNFGYDHVDHVAGIEPDRLAILYVNDKGVEKHITYKEWSEKSDALASFLLSLGIRKGDRVMLVMKRNYEFWYSYVALHKIGAVAIPATYQLQDKDYIYRFNAAGVSAVIATADPYVLDHIDNAAKQSGTLKFRICCRGRREGWLSFEDGVKNAPTFKRPEGDDAPHSTDRMLIFFTSGTNGMPKMAVHNYLYPLAHIFTGVYWHRVVDGGLHITVADTGWAKTGWGKMYGQLMGGSAQLVYDHEKFNAHDMLEMLQKYRPTTFCAPPTIYRFLIKENLSKYDLSSIRNAAIAGEALNPEVFNQFKEATGLKLMEGFGQSESSVIVCTPYYTEPKVGSMGLPVPYLDVDVVDDNGRSTAPGENGEIVIRKRDGKHPTGLLIEYYRDPESTAKVWEGGYYHTGDIAWRDEDGYYWYVGRKDDVIKSSGYRIGPFEVESVIMEHPAVLECAVTGVPHEIRGMVVKATIVLTKGYQPSDELAKEIQNYVKTHTAPYKYPRIVEFVDELPKTTSGKIKRVDIRNMDFTNKEKQTQ